VLEVVVLLQDMETYLRRSQKLFSLCKLEITRKTFFFWKV